MAEVDFFLTYDTNFYMKYCISTLECMKIGENLNDKKTPNQPEFTPL